MLLSLLIQIWLSFLLFLICIIWLIYDSILKLRLLLTDLELLLKRSSTFQGWLYNLERSYAMIAIVVGLFVNLLFVNIDTL